MAPGKVPAKAFGSLKLSAGESYCSTAGDRSKETEDHAGIVSKVHARAHTHTQHTRRHKHTRRHRTIVLS